MVFMFVVLFFSVFTLVQDALHFYLTRIRNDTEVTSISQSESMHHCLATMKTSRVLVHKCSSALRQEMSKVNSDKLRGHLENIHSNACLILKEDIFSADCQNAAGMTIIQITQLFADQQLPKEVSSLMKSKLLDYDTLSPLSKLFFCQGVLATVPNEELVRHHTDDEVNSYVGASLLDMMFKQIWNLVSLLIESFSALSVARALALWTTCALTSMETKQGSLLTDGGYTEYKDTRQKLLEYCWTNWDHPVDCMRHQVNAIFSNIVKLHRKMVIYRENLDCNNDAFICEVLQKIMLSDRHVRGKYSFLACLVENVGVEFILERNPKLPQELYGCVMDQNLSPCVGNLVDVMAKNHLKKMNSSCIDVWHSTWIDGLLYALHTCPPIQHKSYIMQVTLPKLIKCNPLSAQYIIESLQSNRWDTCTSRHHDALAKRHLDTQASSCKDGRSLDTQDNRSLDAQGTMSLDAQCSKSLDAQCSKSLDAQCTKSLDSHNPRSLDAHASTNIDYKGMRLCMLMTCLKIVRASNIIEVECKGDNKQMWQGFVNMTTIKQALCHKNNQVRLDTFALICDTRKTGETLTDCDFNLIKFFLPFNLSSHLPSFRQQLMMLIKKLFIRLQDSGRQHHKNVTAQNHLFRLEDADRLQAYRDFLDWFVERLFAGLQPGSCYPTRVSSLTAISNLCKHLSGCSWYDVNSIFSLSNVQLLLQCFADPYESDKVMAFDLLLPLSQETLGMQDIKQLTMLYKVAFELACSTRPHNCETASFMLRFISRQLKPAVKCDASCHNNIQGIVGDLLDSLSKQIEVASRSLIEAAGTKPMYGVLHCIRELLADVKFSELDKIVTAKFKQIINMLLLICYKVAEVVSPVVCNSSPEGYLPVTQTLDELDISDVDADLDDLEIFEHTADSTMMKVTPQAMLVCCWRSMKEVSLMLGMISQQHEQQPSLLSHQQVIEMGDFFIKLLLESKHRGAFELASVGFNQLCVVLWRSSVTPLQCLPKKWLNNLLKDIGSGGEVLCATRRSAGVPFTIQALVTSEPSSLRRQSLQETMSILIPLAIPTQQDDGQEIAPQVHALNIICALFRDTRLGEDVYPYIADGVKASILGFKSQLWIVRNSSTLLFTALINRIFGVRRQTEELARKNCMTGREFFTRFPRLHAFLLDQLSACLGLQPMSDTGYLQPSLFPILLLLSRLYPSPTDGSDANLSLSPFVPLVQRCGSSAIYKTRTMSARALASLVPSGEISKMVESLIKSLPQQKAQNFHQNEIHGNLLQIHELLQTLKSHHHMLNVRQEVLLQRAISSFKDCMWLRSSVNKCAVTKAEFMNILNIFVMETSWMATTTTGLVPELRQLQEQIARLTHQDVEPVSDELPLDHVALMKAVVSADIRKSDMLANEDTELSLVPSTVSNLEGSQSSGDFTRIVSKHLSSKVYEARLLVLEHIFNRLHVECNLRIDCENQSCQKVFNISRNQDVFKKLVSMLYSETHHECKIKVLEVLGIHPMTLCFPWLFEDGRQLTIIQLAHILLGLATPENVRDDLVCGVVFVAGVLIPHLYESVIEDPEDKSARGYIKSFVELIERRSFAEHTTQLRLAIAKMLNDVTLFLLVDPHHCLGDIPMNVWCTVLQLLQDNDSDVRASMTSCIRSLAKHVPSVFTDSWYYWDVHAHLGLKLAIDIMIEIHLSTNTCSLYKMLCNLVLGEPEEFIIKEIEDDKLFDRGEANTNNDDILLTKMLVNSFCSTIEKNADLKMKIDSALYQSVLKTRLEDFLCWDKHEHLGLEQRFVDTTRYENVQIQLMRINAGLGLLQKTSVCFGSKVNELWDVVKKKCHDVGHRYNFDNIY
ncbi:tRNA (32-2'-O)-methyltransferase regulator THADA-like [Antedon mediterranea]|uniref:tRNA (32-2'-O)-methyltransferase regulator THADA-like n=1 Tax=Antedon mediterranea TaxID=105859 RepID=UPI003AF94FDC